MFNRIYDNENPPANESFDTFSLPPSKRSVLSLLDYEDDKPKKKMKKKRKGKNKRNQKKNVDSTTPYPNQLATWRLGLYVGHLQTKNEMLEKMMKLALATSKGTLRQDTLEVGFELLD